MEVLYPHCAGLGCGQGRPWSPVCGTWWTYDQAGKCARSTPPPQASASADSGARASEGCTVVAMEATGVYWKPVWHVLSDGDFELVLANAKQVKNVPGRSSTSTMPPGWRIFLPMV